ncbi:Hypothetical predicted protein [Octopus vulgaris]|uniref:Uncharacterized protein n=1 Tax=Octopus vulgaris TaxID=6645 RepID=A0AA36FB02_OCTVU|nr:Hypothetical predicted protein [Octopus vulgaris]
MSSPLKWSQHEHYTHTNTSMFLLNSNSLPPPTPPPPKVSEGVEWWGCRSWCPHDLQNLTCGGRESERERNQRTYQQLPTITITITKHYLHYLHLTDICPHLACQM